MRRFKSFAVVTALMLGGTSFAVSSTPSSYDQASLQLVATGAAQEAVNFSVPQASIVIPASQVFPGNSFTVTIPVTNTSDRKIKVEVSKLITGALSDKLTATPQTGSVEIEADSDGNLVYVFTLAAAADGDQGIEGKAFTVTFDLVGTSVNDGSESASF